MPNALPQMGNSWGGPGIDIATCSVVEKEPMPSLSWAHIFWSMTAIQRITAATHEKQEGGKHYTPHSSISQYPKM